MKNKFLFLMAMLSFLLILGTSQVYAYTLVLDIDPPTTDTIGDLNWFGDDVNGQYLHPTNPDVEQEWLTSLLGGTDPGEYIMKDEDGGNGWQEPADWAYAVLKFGGAGGGEPNGTQDPDHWAITYAGGLTGISGLSSQGLSHITYFGGPSVPEPQTMLLLGTGLIGLAAFGRKKFRKS